MDACRLDPWFSEVRGLSGGLETARYCCWSQVQVPTCKWKTSERKTQGLGLHIAYARLRERLPTDPTVFCMCVGADCARARGRFRPGQICSLVLVLICVTCSIADQAKGYTGQESYTYTNAVLRGVASYCAARSLQVQGVAPRVSS